MKQVLSEEGDLLLFSATGGFFGKAHTQCVQVETFSKNNLVFLGESLHCFPSKPVCIGRETKYHLLRVLLPQPSNILKERKQKRAGSGEECGLCIDALEGYWGILLLRPWNWRKTIIWQKGINWYRLSLLYYFMCAADCKHQLNEETWLYIDFVLQILSIFSKSYK